ncbi:MAG: carboxypeptidase-like regulatory domain-containing protein, partial [Longimicrobiales bacterium]
MLVRTEPDTFATLTDLGASVRFVFDERISEAAAGGNLDDAITVSPSTGPVRVRHERTSLRVEVEGGFRPGLVYRVTLLPIVRDMFGNQLRDPFELVFSTGGVAPPTAVAGQVWNRSNGTSTRGALVHAVSADSLVYVARSDESGIYTFRYLPEGEYRITAFEDVDRDGTLDARETQGAVTSTVAAGDTLLIDVPTLPTDTSAAVPVGASALDSVTISVEFDDYLEASAPAGEVRVTLAREGGGSAPTVVRVFHEPEYGDYVTQVADSFARLDSIDAAARAPEPVPAATDSSAAVPVGAAAGSQAASGRPLPPRLEGSLSTRSMTGRPLPTRRLVGLLDAPLEADVEYQVTTTGVVNLNG